MLGECTSMNDVDLCPICSAGIAECDHEIVRWSLYALEFEPSALLTEVLTLNDALIKLLCHSSSLDSIVKSRELERLYKLGVAEGWLDPDDDTEHRALPEAGVDAVLDAIGELPGVLDRIEGLPPKQPTRVLWASDARTVRDRILGWVRELEIEVGRRQE
jgi:hypothetical protein